jgi:hypothetical protein
VLLQGHPGHHHLGLVDAFAVRALGPLQKCAHLRSPASQRALAKAARAAAPALRPVEARIDAWAGDALAWLLAPEIDAIEAERLREDGVQIVDDASSALLPAVVDGATALRPSERAALVREAKRALR